MCVECTQMFLFAQKYEVLKIICYKFDKKHAKKPNSSEQYVVVRHSEHRGKYTPHLPSCCCFFHRVAFCAYIEDVEAVTKAFISMITDDYIERPLCRAKV